MVAPAMVGPPPPSDELESQAERTEALKEAFSHYLDGNTVGRCVCVCMCVVKVIKTLNAHLKVLCN